MNNSKIDARGTMSEIPNNDGIDPVVASKLAMQRLQEGWNVARARKEEQPFLPLRVWLWLGLAAILVAAICSGLITITWYQAATIIGLALLAGIFTRLGQLLNRKSKD